MGAVHAVYTAGFDGVFHQQDGVFGRHAHQHDQADQRRHGEALVGDQQSHERATQRQRQGRQNREGVEEGLEQQDQHDVDAQHARQHRQAKAGEQFALHLGVADFQYLHARGQGLQAGQLFHRGLHVAQRDAGELNLEVDVARPVVAVDHGRTTAEGQRGHLAQHHRPLGPGHRQPRQHIEIGPRLRRELDHNRNLALRQVHLGQGAVVVAHGRNPQRFCDGRTRHAHLCRLAEIGCDADFRAHQGRAGLDAAHARDGAQIALDGAGGHGQGVAVVAGQRQDVFLPRPAQAHLAAHARQVGHRFTDLVLDHLFARALAPLGQLDGQRRLAGLGGPLWRKRVAAGRTGTDGGVHRLDVVQGADQHARLLGGVNGLLQRRAGRQLDVDLGLRVVVGRDEALWQQRNQHDGPGEKQAGAEHGDPAMAYAPCCPARIGVEPGGFVLAAGPGPHLLHERTAARPVGAVFHRHERLHEIGCHHGRERTRHDQRGKNGQRSRPAELFEELAGDTGHERGGQEHGDQREGRGDHRQADFVGRLHGRLVRRLAHAHVAHDVLHLHDGVVHQNTDHQRHGQQGHHVDGEAQVVHADESRDRRQRQGHGRDHGGAEVAQEQPDHQHGQYRALVQQRHGAGELFFHGGHEVERLGDLEVGAFDLQRLELFANALTDFHLAGAAAAGDFKTHHRFAIEERRRRGLGDGVLDLGDLVQAHAATIGQRQLQLGEVFGRLQGRQGAQGLLAAAHVGAATGAFDLHPGELAGNVGSGCPQRLQPHRVEQDLDFAVHAAHTVDRPHAAHREQQLADVVLHEPRDGFVVHLVGAHGVGQHSTAGQLDLVDDGLVDVGRQIAAHLGHGRAHVVQGFLRVLLDAEFGGDGDHAVLHLGVDVLEALQRRHAVFDRAGHVVLELVGRGAGQAGNHGDVGHVQVGKVLHFHGLERVHARQRQHDEQHDGRNRVFNRPS